MDMFIVMCKYGVNNVFYHIRVDVAVCLGMMDEVVHNLKLEQHAMQHQQQLSPAGILQNTGIVAGGSGTLAGGMFNFSRASSIGSVNAVSYSSASSTHNTGFILPCVLYCIVTFYSLFCSTSSPCIALCSWHRIVDQWYSVYFLTLLDTRTISAWLYQNTRVSL